MKRTIALLSIALLAAWSTAGATQEPSRSDTSGKGAVLCLWSIYVDLRAQGDGCGLARAPLDDEMETAITRIEAFVLANTTHGLTQAALDGYKARVKASWAQPTYQQCASTEQYRAMMLDVAAATDDLLSIPREPVWDPCL